MALTPLGDERVLLQQGGRAGPSDTKTVQVIAFDVPEGVDALSLRFDYGPRVSTAHEANAKLLDAAFELHTRRRREALTPDELQRHRDALGVDKRASSLDNLLNVVLIDAEGRWRGRWDRNPSSDSGALVLSREHASRGFLAGDLPAGKWTAAIECHGIFGVDVTFEIAIAARPAPLADEVAKINGPVARPDVPLDEAKIATSAQPLDRGADYYFGEMHSHTVHSDGKWELHDLAGRARAVGADFLCLTDHNTVSGLLDPPELPLTLVPGIELTTFHGHHPIYGTKKMVPWHEDGRVLPLAETSKTARALGAIVGVAHPFVPGDPLCTGCRMVEGLDPTSFDLMEVWYRRWTSPGSDNVAAYALWNRYWSEGHRITAVAARDWHGKEQDAPFPSDMPFTGIWAEENTTEALLEGLRRGRVIMSGGPILDLRLVSREANRDERAFVGGTLVSASPPVIEVDARRVDEHATLKIFSSNRLVREMMLKQDGVVVLEGVADQPGFYRAELWANAPAGAAHAGERPRCITNHVVWRAP